VNVWLNLVHPSVLFPMDEDTVPVWFVSDMMLGLDRANTELATISMVRIKISEIVLSTTDIDVCTRPELTVSQVVPLVPVRQEHTNPLISF